MSRRKLLYLLGFVLFAVFVSGFIYIPPHVPSEEQIAVSNVAVRDEHPPVNEAIAPAPEVPNTNLDEADAKASPTNDVQSEAPVPPIQDITASPSDRRKDVLSVLDILFRAAADDDENAASAVSAPETSVAKNALELKNVFSESDLLGFDVYSGSTNALAVSELVNIQDGAQSLEGYLVFTLVQQDGKWLASDIDFEDDDGGLDEIKRFLERYPDAELFKR